MALFLQLQAQFGHIAFLLYIYLYLIVDTMMAVPRTQSCLPISFTSHNRYNTHSLSMSKHKFTRMQLMLKVEIAGKKVKCCDRLIFSVKFSHFIFD